VIIACVSIMLYMRIDQVMLGEMAGSEAVGIYSAATRLSEVWYFLPMAVVTSIFPFVIQAKAGDQEVYHHRLTQLFSLMTVLALSIIIPMTIFADRLVGFIYGDPYAAAGPVLALHIWACWFVFLGIAQDPWDMAENQNRLAMLRTVLGALINIVLNIILIPRYAAFGAAVATVISYGISNVMLNAFNMKTRVIFLLQLKSVFFLRHLK
jgi:PST family polysaccharide transporter